MVQNMKRYLLKASMEVQNDYKLEKIQEEEAEEKGTIVAPKAIL